MTDLIAGPGYDPPQPVDQDPYALDLDDPGALRDELRDITHGSLFEAPNRRLRLHALSRVVFLTGRLTQLETADLPDDDDLVDQQDLVDDEPETGS